jgi:hypothetical protein
MTIGANAPSNELLAPEPIPEYFPIALSSAVWSRLPRSDESIFVPRSATVCPRGANHPGQFVERIDLLLRSIGKFLWTAWSGGHTGEGSQQRRHACFDSGGCIVTIKAERACDAADHVGRQKFHDD